MLRRSQHEVLMANKQSRSNRRHFATRTIHAAQAPDPPTGAIMPETRLVWVESPTNPLLRLVDLAASATIPCHA